MSFFNFFFVATGSKVLHTGDDEVGKKSNGGNDDDEVEDVTNEMTNIRVAEVISNLAVNVNSGGVNRSGKEI